MARAKLGGSGNGSEKANLANGLTREDQGRAGHGGGGGGRRRRRPGEEGIWEPRYNHAEFNHAVEKWTHERRLSSHGKTYKQGSLTTAPRWRPSDPRCPSEARTAPRTCTASPAQLCQCKRGLWTETWRGCTAWKGLLAAGGSGLTTKKGLA